MSTESFCEEIVICSWEISCSKEALEMFKRGIALGKCYSGVMESFVLFVRVLNLVNLPQQCDRYQSVEVVELGEFVCDEI